MKKKDQLKIYYKTEMQSILTSKFLCKTTNDKLTNDHLLTIVPTAPSHEKTNFLYIYLLTGNKLPHMRKFYIPWKFRYQRQRIKKKNFIISFLKSTCFLFLSRWMTQIVPFHSSTENEAVIKTQNYWKLMVWQAPLTDDTYRLQSPNNYISILPIGISLQFNSSSISKHLFFFSFFKFLSNQTLIDLQLNNTTNILHNENQCE